MGANLSNLLSGQSGAYEDITNAYSKAMSSMQGNQQQGQASLQPYEDAGKAAIDPYQKFLAGLPDQMNGKWMDTYQQSPYAKYLTNTGLTSMNNAAAATGTLGSGANQQENAGLANQIAGQDMQNYFGNMMAQNNQYMGGLNSLMGMGAQTAMGGAGLNQQYSHDIASLIANQGQAQGNANAASAQGKSSMMGLLGAVGGL